MQCLGPMDGGGRFDLRTRISYHGCSGISWGNLRKANGMRHILLKGILWVSVYLVLILAPLFVLLLRPSPAGLGFWRDLAVALGFAGAAMMAAMFVITARFRRPSAPFGIDIIYYFHRQIAAVGLAFIFAHGVLLGVEDPALFSLLTSGQAPWALRTGLIGMAAFLLIVLSSWYRQPLGLHYDEWRLWHAVLAVLAVAATFLHLEATRYYLDAPWKGLLWLLIVISVLTVILYVRLFKPLRLLRHPYQVEEILTEVPGTWTLVLRPLGFHAFRFLPGQFAWLTIWHSPFALKEHPFSMTSSAERPDRLTFSIKAAGDFTSRIKEVKSGERVYVDGPYGAFSLDRYPAPGYVFIVGGIGSAPIMAMLRTMADRGDRRPVQLIYGGGRPHRLLFTRDLEALQQKLNLEVLHVLEKPPPDWQGEVGYITAELLNRRLPSDRAAREFFICGPVPMLHMVERGLHRAGVPLSRIHTELFELV